MSTTPERDPAHPTSTEAPEAPPPPGNRMGIAILSLLGLLVSLYLLAHAMGLTGPIVCGVGDCETVQASRWARVGPVPVPAIGVAGYTALLVLAVAGLQEGLRRSRAIGWMLLGGSAVGLLYSAWLTYLEASVIRAWCAWCVTSAVLITLIFLLSLPELRRERPADRPT